MDVSPVLGAAIGRGANATLVTLVGKGGSVARGADGTPANLGECACVSPLSTSMDVQLIAPNVFDNQSIAGLERTFTAYCPYFHSVVA